MTTIIYWLLHFANVSSHPFVCLGLLLPHWLCVYIYILRFKKVTDIRYWWWFRVGYSLIIHFASQATGYASKHHLVPVPSQDRWEGCSRKGIRHENGGMMEVGHRQSRRIVGASASAVLPCSIKSRRWRAIMEEVDKGCSKFCITVGTATRTAGILIHGQVKGAGC